MDGENFRFRRAYLQAALRVLEGLFSFAAAPDATRPRTNSSDAPMVDLTDDGSTLENLLLFLRPRDDSPRLETYDELERFVSGRRGPDASCQRLVLSP